MTNINGVLAFIILMLSHIPYSYTSDWLPINDSLSIYGVNEKYISKNTGQIIDQHGSLREDILFATSIGETSYFFGANQVSYQTFNSVISSSSDNKEDEINFNKLIGHRIDLTWIDANSCVEVFSTGELQYYENHYTPHRKTNKVPFFSELWYENLYSGVNLRYYIHENNLKYDFIVRPGSDYTQIKIKVNGATPILMQDGSIALITPTGVIQEAKPFVYQDKEEIEAFWDIDGNNISFLIPNVNPNKTLVIDPLIRSWGTYFGGNAGEFGNHSVSDSEGNVYITGTTSSLEQIATSGSYQTNLNGDRDLFLSKFNSDGVLLWSTYYGGTGTEEGGNICLDDEDNIYLAATTNSTDSISTSDAHQTHLSGGKDGMLIKFNPSGQRIWGTYFGGSGDETIYSVALDSDNGIYITGQTSSFSNVASSSAYQNELMGTSDGFLARFNEIGTLEWSTYFGGNAFDEVRSCAVGVNNDIFIFGTTTSTEGVSTSGAFQTNYGSGNFKTFLAKFSSDGQRLWSTYFGGNSSDYARGCTTDFDNNIVITGFTSSSQGIATQDAHQPMFGGGVNDAFFAKFNSSGSRLWSTYYGGEENDPAFGCITDSNNNIYLVGQTSSTQNIASTNSHQPNYGGGSWDAYLVKFDKNGSRIWGSFYGGENAEWSYSVSIDADFSLFIQGSTISDTNIATNNGHMPSRSGNYDAFLVKFNQNITNSTSIEIEKNPFHVFPNPANNTICINRSPHNSNPPIISIFNSIGVLVLQKRLEPGFSSCVEISELKNGIYWLNIDGGYSTSFLKL